MILDFRDLRRMASNLRLEWTGYAGHSAVLFGEQTAQRRTGDNALISVSVGGWWRTRSSSRSRSRATFGP